MNLSKESYKRKKDLERKVKAQNNKRGRKQPSQIPHKLTRTSAFAPKSRGLITDSRFDRFYIVDKHSVLRIMGREMGSKHRDLLYALFRLKPEIFVLDGRQYCETKTTWRELLFITNKTAHKNNIRTLLDLCTDFQKVVIQVYNGDSEAIRQQLEAGKIMGTGFSENIISSILWSGDSLDSNITIRYGAWVHEMFRTKKLVSLNAHVQFRLKSDYAKAFWPFIDSQNYHTFVDEETLAQLSGLDLSVDKIKEDGRVIQAPVGTVKLTGHRI